MKKNVLLGVIMALLMLSCSDNGEKAARDYALQFAKAVTSGDSAQVVKMYPNAALAYSLALSFVEDSIKIERNEKGDSILIHYTPEIWVRALKDENNSIQVVSSKGLFAYPAEQLAFAKSTGQYANSLDDKGNAERMADKSFQVYMVKKAKDKIKESLKIVSTKGCDYGEGEGGAMSPTGLIVIVKNQSDVKIEGKTYRVVVTDCDFALTPDGDWDPFSTSYSYHPHPLAGKDIMPGEQLQFKYSSNAIVLGRSATIQIQDIGNDLLASYQTTGREYEEYLATREAQATATSSSEDQRVDMSMRGTISTISNVSFVINGTRGVLEYVMNGNSVVSELRFGSLTPDGTLTVKSYTPEGKQKGTFSGKLTTTNGSKQYKGQFINVKGGRTTFSFSE